MSSYRSPADMPVIEGLSPDRPVNPPWYKRWFCNPWNNVAVLADTKEVAALQDAFGRRWYRSEDTYGRECWVSMSAPFTIWWGDSERAILAAILISYRLAKKAESR